VRSRSVGSPRGGPPVGRKSSHTITSRSGSGNGKGRSNVELTRLKIAVFAPMPSAKIATAVKVKPGVLRSVRSA